MTTHKEKGPKAEKAVPEPGTEGDRAQVPSGVHSYMKRLPVHYDSRQRDAKRRDHGSPWTVSALCAAYDWPTDAPGGGVIGIIELGGGWIQSDVDLFFKGAGLPAPKITDITVSGPGNSKCNPQNEADGEVALDIQVAGASYAIATGHAATIRVYWVDGSDQNAIATGISHAAKDKCDVFSISWGADEGTFGADGCKTIEQAAIAATRSGMVVFAASGDNDSSDGGPDRANVDCPASAPHIVGCGGTMKPQSGQETVWNDNPGRTDGEGTGGGFSTVFVPMPAWMAGAPHGPGRMVPDIAANADPKTGYEITLYGQPLTVGGTSAVAPLYSGLFAAFGKGLGFISPQLWTNHLAFTLITSGDNGAYRASDSPSPCTGLGSPMGSKIAALFKASTAAKAA